MSVAIWSRREERNAEAVAELEELGATAIGVQRDVSDEDNVAGASERRSCVPQFNARMVMQIWSLTCENTPDSGAPRV